MYPSDDRSVLEWAVVADPFGNEFCLIRDVDRADADDFVRAAGSVGSGWRCRGSPVRGNAATRVTTTCGDVRKVRACATICTGETDTS